jgi:quercetin dioxygenase-like cupin family protein
MMNFKRALVMAAVAVLMTAGLVQATPSSGLSSSLLARGSWTQTERHELVKAIKDMDKADPRGKAGKASRTTVAVVRAEIAAGGTTGWHTHTGPSVIVVQSGELTVYEAHKGHCESHLEQAGGAFFHTADTHTFVNHGTVPVVFFVTYFAPSGGLLVDAPDPGVC